MVSSRSIFFVFYSIQRIELLLGISITVFLFNIVNINFYPFDRERNRKVPSKLHQSYIIKMQMLVNVNDHQIYLVNPPSRTKTEIFIHWTLFTLTTFKNRKIATDDK
jgi:hypothetical protein